MTTNVRNQRMGETAVPPHNSSCHQGQMEGETAVFLPVTYSPHFPRLCC
ncbi:MAG: hypothetical protein GY943_24680, partial [Chloroflexi bacterium]|nr:hypothetical protein [Chloroflexota bacterium]